MSKINELVALLNTVPAGQLTENAVQTYFNILNIEIVEKSSTSAVEVKSEESPKANVSRLIAEAKKDIDTNRNKYGFTASSSINTLEEAAFDVARGKYQYAYTTLNICSSLANNFAKYPDLMAALAELI